MDFYRFESLPSTSSRFSETFVGLCVASIWLQSTDARCASGREVAAVTAVGIEMDQGDEPECLLGATANVVRIVLHTAAFWGGRSPPWSRPMPIVLLVDDAYTLVGPAADPTRERSHGTARPCKANRPGSAGRL